MESEEPIIFRNKRSKERVRRIVNELKEASCKFDFEREKHPETLMEFIKDQPELYIKSPSLEKLQGDLNPKPIPRTTIAGLKPFLFPNIPAHIPEGSVSEYTATEMRKNLLVEANMEHHRLLYTFQDRLARETILNEDTSVFQLALSKIAAESGIPANPAEKKKETLQSRYSTMMKRTQKTVAAVIDRQKRRSKLIHDSEMFQAFVAAKESKLSSVEVEPLQIPIPFAFLTDTSAQKQ